MAQPNPPRHRTLSFLLIVLVTGAATVAVAALLVNIFQRKQEARDPYLKLVKVTEDTTDPAPWGTNWQREYDGYKRTAEPSKTNFGGGDADITAEKAERYPWLTRMFAGYAFSLDYRDRRGHAYMLLDQAKTRRVTEKPQPGSCLHCHGSVMPLYRQAGNGDVFAGFEAICKLPYQDARAQLDKVGSMNPIAEGTTQVMKHVDGGHSVSCVDCHDPATMQLRVTRPGFIRGIQALAAGTGAVPHLPSIELWRKGDRAKPYDPNVDGTRQEMRSYVCGQCHVEYYCGPKTTLFFPWNDGLAVDDAERYYDNYKFPDGHRFFDWKHAETGAEVLKAQHPEFETWGQGIHARSGVACADCHMPYERAGAMKVSDHWVRSPLLHINRSCQVCHHYEESELAARVAVIQNRNFALLQRSGAAVIGMLDAIVAAKKEGASDAQLAPALALQRKAQWRVDYVAAENSMGFHAPQESARVLGEAIDYARQAETLAAKALKPAATTQP